MTSVAPYHWYDTEQGRHIADAEFLSIGLNGQGGIENGVGAYSNEELARKFPDLTSFLIFVEIVRGHKGTPLGIREVASLAAEIYEKLPFRY